MTTAAKVGQFLFMSLFSECDFEINNLLDTRHIYIFCYQASGETCPLTETLATTVTLKAYIVTLNTRFKNTNRKWYTNS